MMHVQYSPGLWLYQWQSPPLLLLLLGTILGRGLLTHYFRSVYLYNNASDFTKSKTTVPVHDDVTHSTVRMS